ncbi:hypothetical protein YC2023_121929 [Brassica napus]
MVLVLSSSFGLAQEWSREFGLLLEWSQLLWYIQSWPHFLVVHSFELYNLGLDSASICWKYYPHYSSGSYVPNLGFLYHEHTN